MKKFTSTIPLDAIGVASPCHADWDKMRGDDTTRFCSSCQKNVYNLSGMSREEAQNLIAEKEGNLCVRFYKREDGTMLTGDCPIGIEMDARIKPRFAPLALAASALVLVAAISTGFAQNNRAEMGDMAVPENARVVTMGEARSVITMGKAAAPAPTATPSPAPLMGAPTPLMGLIACPPPTPTPAPKSAKSHKKSQKTKATKAKKPAPTPKKSSGGSA